MKIVYGWVVNWAEIMSQLDEPKITVDFFFTSKEVFQGLYGCSDFEKQILIPVKVPVDFDNLDYIPENY